MACCRRSVRLALALAIASLAAACATTAPPPPDDPEVRARSAQLVLSALNFLDVNYRWGGNTAAEGFDCSGFTRHVYETIGGIPLPRKAEEQAGARGFAAVGSRELIPGDLVFFNTLGRTYSHVGIYVGDGRFVHAPRTGAQVRIESMQSAYWANRYTGARRFVRI
jgi:cell wall-associated NlpC family hydrolase